ncbi:hypothetical protein HDU93_000007 [Gonapodya sp. JEL0774]|nr:hypothetical protein HDU93_000007 [Gonapodya sp. JEL0774]
MSGTVQRIARVIPLKPWLQKFYLPAHADEELDIDWDAVFASALVDLVVTILLLGFLGASLKLAWNAAGRGNLAHAAEARRKRKEETDLWEAEERAAAEAAKLAAKEARRKERAAALGVALEDLPDSEAEMDDEEVEYEDDDTGDGPHDSAVHLPLRRRLQPNLSTPGNGPGALSTPISAASSSPDYHHTPTPLPKRGRNRPRDLSDADSYSPVEGDQDGDYEEEYEGEDPGDYEVGQGGAHMQYQQGIMTQHSPGGMQGQGQSGPSYIDVQLTRHVYPGPPPGPMVGPGGRMYYPPHGGYPQQGGGFGGISVTVGGGGGRPPAVLRLDDQFPLPHPSPPGNAGYLPAPYPPQGYGYPAQPGHPQGMWVDAHGFPVDANGYPLHPQQPGDDGYDYDYEYDYNEEGVDGPQDMEEQQIEGTQSQQGNGQTKQMAYSPTRSGSAPGSVSASLSSGVESGPIGYAGGPGVAASEGIGSGRLRPESGQSVRFAEEIAGGDGKEGKEGNEKKEHPSNQIRSTASSRLRAETIASRARQQQPQSERDRARSRSRSRSRPPQSASRNGTGTTANGRTTPGGRASRQSRTGETADGRRGSRDDGEGDLSDAASSAVSSRVSKVSSKRITNSGGSGKLGSATKVGKKDGEELSPTGTRPSDHRRNQSTASMSSIASVASARSGARRAVMDDFDTTPAGADGLGKEYVASILKGHLPTNSNRINEALIQDGEGEDWRPFETSRNPTSVDHVPQLLGHLPTNPNRLNEMLLQESTASAIDLPRFDVSSAVKDQEHQPSVVKGHLPTSSKRVTEQFAGGLRDYTPPNSGAKARK